MDSQQQAGNEARTQVIAALRELTADGSDRSRSADLELLEALADAVLRRLDATELASIEPQVTARWMAWLAERLEQLESGTADVIISTPATGLDGQPARGSVVDVIADDRPFLLSTVTDELHQGGIGVVRRWHPIVGVTTDVSGGLDAIVAARDAERRISVLHLELDRPLTDGVQRELADRLKVLITDVTRATDDFGGMRERLNELATELRFGAWTDPVDPGIEDTTPSDVQEAADLLDWICDDNMVLLGVREYRGPIGGAVEPVADSGFGLLREDDGHQPSPVARADRDQGAAGDASATAAGGTGDEVIDISRTRARSTVQRRDHMLQVRLRHHDGDEQHEVRILGLFTRKGLAEPVRATPVVRRKLRAVLEREDIVDASHDEGTLTALFQSVPKDELFILDIDELHQTVVQLFHAQERGEVRTLVRQDPTSTTATVLISVPRDRYGPQLRERIDHLLTQRYAPKRIDVDLSLGHRREALVRFLLHLPDPAPVIDASQLRADVTALSRSWIDELVTALHETVGRDDDRTALAHRLPPGYQDAVGITTAVADVELLHAVQRGDEPLAIRVDVDESGEHHLRVARRGGPLELSAFLPILESLGMTVMQEVPHRLTGEDPLYLQDFTVTTEHLHRDDQPRLTAAILAAYRGHLEIDRLNALVLHASIEWRDVMLLRALRRLRRQMGSTYSPEYMNEVIVGQPATARALIAYFRARFDPDGDEPRELEARRSVVEHCDALPRLDQDRILRGILELIDATVRTNAFRDDAVADDTGEPYLSLKLDPSRIAGLPAPTPFRETFVSAPGVEGVHLRFGPVARGGLRWSDRRDDVRTEVFDLVKAQLLKNALIVPTGAKGGFVLAHEPDDPGQLRDEVRRQYVTFVRGLLDVADDLDGDDVVAPRQVRPRDDHDPYLVVAADRGTAALSDTANAIARRYGFWLDDAFASGGSNGYDHKSLGVTAKGAWLAVRRHFRELGIDVQDEPVTVAGVGDMSGDVFGNAMLQSEAIKLVVAFDHRHIFLDPDPDPTVAFNERRRLFELPRSSWQDYDPALISEGGGVFPRSARSIEISDEVRELLRISADRLSPIDLIRAVLCAPVDLLFAGGIGTYVKSSSETTAEVGDRANDELRVDARDVRARVIGEGANLFMTQRGRVEYARRGGHVNQDAIDNAGGVATSDCEVNLKILLKEAIDRGDLEAHDRDRLLADMAQQVVTLVMGMVDRQAAAISRERRRSTGRLGAYDRMMTRLAASHALDRGIERLPDSEDLEDRAEAGAGLTRPELATLLAWSKRELKEHLLAGRLVDLDFFAPMIRDQLPPAASERFGPLLTHHRLRRELVATATANEITDRMGVTFVAEFADTTTVDVDQAILAYQVARESLSADTWWALLDDLEAVNDPDRVSELYEELEHLVAGVATGVIRHPSLANHPQVLSARIAEVVKQLQSAASEIGTDDQRLARAAYVRWLIDDLIDPELARFLSLARDLTLAPEIADVVEDLQGVHTAAEVADAFLRLGNALQIERLEALLARAVVDGSWPHRQRDGIRSDLRRARRDAARLALQQEPKLPIADAVNARLADWQTTVGTVTRLVDDLDTDHVSLDALAVCARAVRQVVERG